ncbi:class E sortase [Actinokineospora pegani]|uniref:class E sortase n=1 Tax=Actinokineospora pegani TaxID=2654637 RepID=UPI001F1D00C6|nr:class E sortase [Actinokineospora pegani]
MSAPGRPPVDAGAYPPPAGRRGVNGHTREGGLPTDPADSHAHPPPAERRGANGHVGTVGLPAEPGAYPAPAGRRGPNGHTREGGFPAQPPHPADQARPPADSRTRSGAPAPARRAPQSHSRETPTANPDPGLNTGRRHRPDGVPPAAAPTRPGGRRRRVEGTIDGPTEINGPDGELVLPEARTEVIAPVTEVIPVVRPQVDPPTERIAPKQVEAPAVAPSDEQDVDEYYDDDEDYDDEDYDDELEDEPGDEPKRNRAAKAIMVAGEAMVTLGMVVLLFVIYEVWITDLISASKQNDVTSALDEQWDSPALDDGPERQQKFQFADGEGMAKLYIPALGEDYNFTVVEGTTEADLEIGPGHYKNSALPGQPGNFAVAGHRVGKGAPFNDLDLLESCDAMVVETQTSWFVYRLLPVGRDATNWSAKASDPLCAGKDGGEKVEPLTGAYNAATGRQIVTPQQSDVIAPVPGNSDSAVPESQRRKLITLTTCHPKFSNKERMILQGIMVREQAKTADRNAIPPELGETG